MKAKVKIEKEVNITKLLVKAGVRYWNDCKYSKDNGQTWIDDEEDTKEESERFKNALPFVEKLDIGYKPSDYWCLEIDVETGKVKDWPKDFCIETFFKICDDGLYQLIDEEGNVVWDSVKTRYYYVPDFLALEDEGYGDYMYLNIDGEGNIEHWEEAKSRIMDILEKDDDE